ncbi:MAG TPA: chemotaxis protein CheB [Cyclobacteriaceae bacterium]|nr:chemotaxis protein CheB [Cyclobacteriaceae bacterium]
MSRFNLNNSYKAIVIGGSAGSFQGITKILSQLPRTFPLPIIMCLHRLKHVRNGFVEALSIKSVFPVVEPYDKEQIKKGGVYLAPSNYHMSVELGNHFAMSTEEMINNSRPAIDVTLGTAAYVFREKLIGILLSGANRDGGMGMKHIKDKGGLTIVQEPAECMIDTMPKAAMALTPIDHVLKLDDIVSLMNELDKHYR